jgi:type IV fimbrial biogenesis protein FimT
MVIVSNLMKRIDAKGFNLIELMVSLAVATILMVIAIPNFTAWLASNRVRNVSESINYGLIQARSEAIRRNELVSFSLNSDTSWEIRDASNNLLNQKGALESSRNTIVIDNADEISFNGVGAVSNNFDGSDTLNNVFVYSTENNDGIQSFTVKIDNGGAITICSYPKNATPTC